MASGWLGYDTVRMQTLGLRVAAAADELDELAAARPGGIDLAVGHIVGAGCVPSGLRSCRASLPMRR